MSRARKVEVSAEQREPAIKRLRKLLPHGSKLYTIKIHTPQRNIGGVFAVLTIANKEIVNISGMVSDAIDKPWDDRGGVWSNCGFDIVIKLSYALHGTENKGLQGKEALHFHSTATPERFKAGYSLEHVML